MSTQFVQRSYSYRGKTLDELRALDFKEFIKLLPSHRRRFVERNWGHRHIKLSQKLRDAREAIAGQAGARPKVVRTRLRNMVVFPEFVGNIIGIYRGNRYEDIEIKPDMIGCVFADFAMSKVLVNHGKAGVGSTRGSSATSLR